MTGKWKEERRKEKRVRKSSTRFKKKKANQSYISLVG